MPDLCPALQRAAQHNELMVALVACFTRAIKKPYIACRTLFALIHFSSGFTRDSSALGRGFVILLAHLFCHKQRMTYLNLKVYQKQTAAATRGRGELESGACQPVAVYGGSGNQIFPPTNKLPFGARCRCSSAKVVSQCFSLGSDSFQTLMCMLMMF